MPDIWPFGKKEEDETAAPNTAILEVPGTYKHGMRYPGEFIRIRFNEDGTVADREKVSQSEALGAIDDGEAFMADERQIQKIREGKMSISEAYRHSLKKAMKDEAEQAPEEESDSWLETKRQKSPIGGEGRKSQIDKTIEEATGGGNY